MVGRLALDQLIGVRVPASQPIRRLARRDLRLRAHRRAARPDAGSTARLIPRCALASRTARLLPSMRRPTDVKSPAEAG